MPLGGRSWLQPEDRYESVVRFLGEQDGKTERRLKTAVAPVLAEFGVGAAYLVRVDFGEAGSGGVALCLRSREDRVLVDRLGEVFAGIVARGVALDIIFLSAIREDDVRRVCTPFYRASEQAHPADGGSGVG